MSDPFDRPRIYINWTRIRPTTFRGWLLAVGGFIVALAVLALVMAVASTLFIIGIVVSIVSATVWYISSFFQKRGRDVIPYRDDDYA